MSSTPLTHFDSNGRAQMIDVSTKAETHRIARAAGWIAMQPKTLARIVEGTSGKGDVLGVARIAAIQAAKRTADLIPLCHGLPLTRITVDFEIDPSLNRVRCLTSAECVGRSGVEMEALCAASVGLLTIYDMCKAADRGMTIGEIRLIEKAGGKSGHWQAA